MDVSAREDIIVLQLWHNYYTVVIIDKTPTHALFIQHYINPLAPEFYI